MVAAAEPAEQDTGSRYVTDRKTIESAFRHFRNRRTKVQLRFEGVDERFTATILDLVDDNVLLEDIVPRKGLTLLRKGRVFSIAARGDGLYMYVDGVASYKSDSERGIPYFWIRMPSSVLYQQRRRSARIELPLRVKAQGARIHIAADTTQLQGDILDLSAGGVRAQFFGVDSSPVQPEQVLTSCILQIRDQFELNSQATVRHALLDEDNRILTCGLELTQMHVTDRRRLEQYVQSLARRPGQLA